MSDDRKVWGGGKVWIVMRIAMGDDIYGLTSVLPFATTQTLEQAVQVAHDDGRQALVVTKEELGTYARGEQDATSYLIDSVMLVSTITMYVETFKDGKRGK